METVNSHVHGDIRHLEIWHVAFDPILDVHGDIRHLEKNLHKNPNGKVVHGDIRHLEIATASTVNP